MLEAATDDSPRLRYVVGDDQAERNHMRHSTSETEYDAWAWDQFRPSPDGDGRSSTDTAAA